MIPSPCYVLEEDKLVHNLSILKKVEQAAQVQIICALKGYAMFSTFNVLKKHLSTCTASSLHEALLCYEKLGRKAHFCSPAIIPNEWDQLKNIISHISFNSIHQWHRYKEKIPPHLSVGWRINPDHTEVKTTLYNPCSPGSRLGIRSQELPALLPKQIEGLHFHTLCEEDSYALERTWQVFEKKTKHLLPHIKWLNMGGGHLITKQGYHTSHLINLLKNIKLKYPNLHIILEPGEAIGWQTGYLRSTVLDIVTTNTYPVAILDCSFTTHMPDCLEMPYKPNIRGAINNSSKETFTYIMGGLSCLAGDQVGLYNFNAPIQIGDSIIFEDMIHYTMVKTTTFNGINLPSIGIMRNTGFQLVKQFGYTDYISRLS